MIEVSKQKAKLLFRYGIVIYCIPSSIPVESSNLNIQLDKRYHFDFDYHFNRVSELHCPADDKFVLYVNPVTVKVASSPMGYNVLSLNGYRLNSMPLRTEKGLVRFMNSMLFKPLYPGALLPSVRNKLVTIDNL